MRPSFNISNFAKVKHTDYQYDALGRNTQIPAADTPNGGNAITLAYNINDQITQISQSGATTYFSYEAEGRRLNETSGNTTTTRHYTDGSDNPTWSTQAATATPNTVTKTEIYTPSLGTGLNVTTTIQAGASTGSMQLHDLRGNTVTTIDLTNNTASAWCSYDEFGNPDTTNPTNTANINYTTYAQAERATNTTGLILMGARVYNPETNQFTSRDPVKGGNENSYTYPNDPITSRDFKGTNFWSDMAFTVAGAALTAVACAATAGVGFLVAGAAIGFIGGGLAAGINASEKHLTGIKQFKYMVHGAIDGMLEGELGFGIGGRVAWSAAKLGLAAVEKQTMAALKRELILSVPSTILTRGSLWGFATWVEANKKKK